MAVTASQDDTAVVWSTVDPQQPHPMAVLTGHKGPVLTAAFTRDGRAVVTGSEDQTAQVWDISQLASIIAEPRSSACTVVGRGLTPEEWHSYLPAEIPYQQSCPS